MKSSYKIGLCIIIGLSGLGVFGSAVLFFVSVPQDVIGIFSALASIIGTAASVALSVAAMIYSNKSSKDAEDSLKKITGHYEALCKEIAAGRISGSLGDAGVQAIIEENTANIKK